MFGALYLLVPFLMALQLHAVAVQSNQNDVSVFANLQHDHIELLKQADELFEATLYTKAIPLYQKILHDVAIQSPLTDLLCSKLVHAFYANNEYQQVLDFLKTYPTMHSEACFYKGMSLNKLMRYQESIEVFEHCLAQEKNHSFPEQEFNFEYAQALFHVKKYDEAAHFFENISKDSLRPLSAIYLARIELAKGQPTKAIERLQNAKQKLPPGDPLNYEFAYFLGEAYASTNNYECAVNWFQNALPQSPEAVSWYPNVLRQLGLTHLKVAEKSTIPEKRIAAFNQAEKSLKTLVALSVDENDVLILGRCFLERARSLKDVKAYHDAEELLSHEERFSTLDAKAQALLLRAGAAPTYHERARFYRYLTQEEHRESPYYCQCWQLRGRNDFEYGEECTSSRNDEEANLAWENAFVAFQKSFELADKNNAPLTLSIIKDLIRTVMLLKTEESLFKTLTMLNEHSINQIENVEEYLYFHGILSIAYAGISEKNEYGQMGEQSLQKLLEKYPQGQFAARTHLMLGTMHYLKRDYQKALSCFDAAFESNPKATETPEMLMCAARCADAIGQNSLSKKYRQRLFENYPDSPYAAEAYFSYYNFHEYLQGDKPAIKHLLSFAAKYAKSPLLITAQYLIGLDLKRDRRSQEGKWLSKKNLTASIEAFQGAETAFDLFFEQKKFSYSEMQYFACIKYRAALERALSNFAISEESQDAKKKIYLQYAEDVLTKIEKEFNNEQSPLWDCFYNTESGKRLQEENLYWLAQVYCKNQKETMADSLLAQMLEKYQSAKITRGYLLSRCWYARAQIAMEKNQFNQALQYLASAEDSAKGKVLSVDQKLDIWIQQSQCYLALKDYDQALLMLSKAVNDDEVSGLRIKAMYLRAEVYEQQGRNEQARRQLDSASKKGGEWARKARDKLERKYGYPSNVHTAYSPS